MSERAERPLGFIDATMIIIGSMIGSGIFIAPSIMAGWIQSPGTLVALWVFAGLFTILGALALAELAAMFPHAGGSYQYLRHAFGPFVAFLFGWTLFGVIQSGFNAAVAIAFAKYLGAFIPALGESRETLRLGPIHINAAQITGCAVIMVLTWVNIRGTRHGARVQNTFTALKIVALAALTLAGLAAWGRYSIEPTSLFTLDVGPRATGMVFLAALAVPLSKALFAYDAWNTATFVAEEVRDPERTLPRALLAGTALTTLIYVLCNIAYLVVVPISDMASIPENRVAQSVGQIVFGSTGATLVLGAILISTFGCVNGLILSGARVCYAMARDGLFFRSCATIDPTRDTPATALRFQAVWSCVLALTGSYDALLTYTTFASVLFGAIAVAALIVLRRTRPDAPRPYRCAGYPFTPLAYLAIAIPFLGYVIVGDPVSTGWGLAIVGSGVPAWWWFRRPPRT